MAQTLSQRALCQLLLGQPDKAMGDLTLLHNLSRLLEAKPTGKPMTLVSAMINVAITGLYAQTVADGFQLQAWREPQITELQKQLGEINLPPQVAESFRTEEAGFIHTLMTGSPTATGESIPHLGAARRTGGSGLKDPMSRFIALAPRGWIYQNMITHARWHQMVNDGADLADGQIHPDKLKPHARRTFGRNRASPASTPIWPRGRSPIIPRRCERWPTSKRGLMKR